jgi:predicted O-methyltransferase YrrM
MIGAVVNKVFGRWLKRYALAYMDSHPVKCAQALRRFSEKHYTLENPERWPASIEGFEDLSFLFHLSQANYGVCLLAFDEAAYLYRLVRGIRAGRIAEIGRYKGGSTLLMAAAMDGETVLDSYDLHLIALHDGKELDRALQRSLARYGLAERVRLHVQDSTAVHPAPESFDLVFVDGNHSYEGARKDFLHWRDAVRPGGHVVFHDAVKTREFSKAAPGLRELIPEIEGEHGGSFEKVDAVGTLVHFRRRSE